MPAEKSALTEALAKVQAELPRIEKGEKATVPTKSGGSYSYSYADLAAVSVAVIPLLGKHGLAWTCRPTINDGGRFVLAYELRHSSGEFIGGEYPLAGNTPQEVGSAITYARRYCLCSVTGVAPESDDDDAQAVRHRDYRRPAFHEGTSRHAPEEPPVDVEEQEQIAQVQHFIDEIKVASLKGLEDIAVEVRQAVNDKAITARQRRQVLDHWERRKAELEAKAAAGSAPEGEQSDGA